MPDGGFPYAGGMYFSSGSSPTDSLGTNVTANASANTKGNWTAVGTTDWSRPFAGLYVWHKQTTAARLFLVDIGYSLDAGSTWVTLIADLMINGEADSFTPIYLPIRIPKGARLGARVQSSTGSAGIRLTFYPQPMAPGWPNGMIVSRTWGQDTSDSGGVQIDPGATVNTKGAYVAFAGFSVVDRVHAIAIALGGQNNALPTAASWLVDVAYDVGGTKNIVMNNLIFAQSGTQGRGGPSFSGFFPCNIPKAATLAVRAQCSINDATDRLIDAALYTLA